MQSVSPTNDSWSLRPDDATSETLTAASATLAALSTSQQSLADLGTVSAAFYAAFVGVTVYISMMVSCLSIFFCFLNAYVYWVQRRSAYAVYLVGVSLGDGVYSVCDLVVNVSRFLVEASTSYARIALTWYLNIFLGTSIRRCAIWLNVFASLERFFAIAFPLEASGTGIFSVAPALTTLAVYVITCACHCYNFLEYSLAMVGPGVWTLVPSALKRDHPDEFERFGTNEDDIRTNRLWFGKVGKGWRQLFVAKNTARALFFFLPLACSLVLNLALVVVLKAHLVQRKAIRTSAGVTGQSAGNKRTSASKATDTQTTKLILVFTFTYVLLDLPRAINITLSTYIKEYGVFEREYYLHQVLTLATQLLTHLTEVTLFLVCLAYSRHFRRTIWNMPCIRFVLRLWQGNKHAAAIASSVVIVTNHNSYDESRVVSMDSFRT